MTQTTPAQEPSATPGRPGVVVHRVVPNTGGRRVALLVFLLSPFLVLALLFFLIWQAQRTGLADHKEPVGAGAGHTGMSNETSGLHLGK